MGRAVIRVTDLNGRTHLLAPAVIATVSEAGASAGWHGIRALIHTTTGAQYEVRETVAEIERQMQEAPP